MISIIINIIRVYTYSNNRKDWKVEKVERWYKGDMIFVLIESSWGYLALVWRNYYIIISIIINIYI